MQVILSVLIQDFSTKEVFFIRANPMFSSVQELSATFGHQRYTKFSTVRGIIVRGPSVYGAL